MELPSSNPKQTRLPVWLRFLDAAPAIPVISTDPGVIQKKYSYWQNRILIGSIIGYAMYYFVRANIGTALPALGADLHITKDKLGIFLTLHGLFYGVSKFFFGLVGDRANARIMLAAGLILSAAFNIFFGFSSTVTMLGVIWMLNGLPQGMGFPPCARLMTHWFSPHKLATKMSIWNISHSAGALLTMVLCGLLAERYGWRYCFFVPGALAFAGAIFALITLRDTPPSLGLPEVEGTVRKPAHEAGQPAMEEKDFSEFVRKKVFGNPYLWLVALANFFVYAIRISILNWGTTFLGETKGIKLASASQMVAAFELSGMAGMMVSGWLTDKLFEGRGVRMSVIFMAMTGVSVLAFWKYAGHSAIISTCLLSCMGFFLYGPQALIGTTAANLGTKRAAGTAVGLTSLFGYASTVASGWGLGKLVQEKGWGAGFAALVVCAVLGTIVFIIAWPAKANGYDGND